MLYSWNNTQRVLESMAPVLLDKYKELSTSQNVSVEVGELEVTLHLPSYWMYIENGRGPGKFPPIQAIQNWIEVKHIVPRNNATVPQVAYLVARKIAREGTQGKHAVAGTLDVFRDIFLPQITQAIVQDITEILKKG